jgi:hypothetical protein
LVLCMVSAPNSVSGGLSSCETHQFRHRDGFRDEFGHSSDLVTLPILQMTRFMESIH